MQNAMTTATTFQPLNLNLGGAPAPSKFGMVAEESRSVGPILKVVGVMFSKKVGKEETRVGIDTLDTYILGVQKDNKVSRSFYAQGTEPVPGNPPLCSSSNGDTPDPGCKQPQSAQCSNCHQNQKGSSANGQSKACSQKIRIAVVNAADPDLKVMTMWVNSTSSFGSSGMENQGMYNLKPYLEWLSTYNYTADMVATRLVADSKAPANQGRIRFQAVGAMPDDVAARLATPENIALAQKLTSNSPHAATAQAAKVEASVVATVTPASVDPKIAALMALGFTAEQAANAVASLSAAPVPVDVPAPVPVDVPVDVPVPSPVSDADAIAADPLAGITWDAAVPGATQVNAPPAWATGFKPV